MKFLRAHTPALLHRAPGRLLPWALCLVVPLSATFIGCGPSQTGMRQYAIKRPSDDDEENEPPSPPPANPPAASEKEPKRAEQGAGEQGAAAKQQQTPAQEQEVSALPGQLDLSKLKKLMKPDIPLGLEQRRKKSLDSLAKIGEGLRAYMQKNRGMFPPSASYTPDGRPMLSWRVLLLPYVGEEELFKQFNLEEPWDGPNNKQLLPYMPMVYASPERFDEKTNYLAAQGTSYLFRRGKRSTVHIDEVEDGLNDTIAVVEVDDEMAQLWTKPAELLVTPQAPYAGLGGLRSDGFFTVWGLGMVGRIPLNVPSRTLFAAFTIDGGENFRYSHINRSAEAAPEEKKAEQVAIGAGSPTDSPSSAANASAANATLPKAAVGGGATSENFLDRRMPQPAESEVTAVLEKFRVIYDRRLKDAPKREDKRKLAKEMLSVAKEMKEDEAGRFALLRAVRNLAGFAGDVDTALAAVDETAEIYQIDAYSLRSEVVQQLIKSERKDRNQTPASAGSSKLVTIAEDLFEEAYERDDFDTAASMLSVLTSRYRRTTDEKKRDQLADRKRRLELARTAYGRMKRKLALLTENPEDPDANLEAGKYYCLVKGQWREGLPLLARGSDHNLKDLAEFELSRPSSGDAISQLADRWWGLADEDRQHRRQLRLRATYWYLQALDRLGANVARVRAEVRVKEVEDDYGSDIVRELGA